MLYGLNGQLNYMYVMYGLAAMIEADRDVLDMLQLGFMLIPAAVVKF